MTRLEEHGTILIQGVEIPTITKMIEHKDLSFWTDNPRVYSLVHQSSTKPNQQEVYQKLRELEHVRELVGDIRTNSGLIDPLIVRSGDMVVLEGNSRLAAYRHLTTIDPIKWAQVRCTLLPEGIEDRLVFSLLGQYHVKGKKDWAPFEKAGFLYRRHKEQNTELSAVAGELGMSAKAARHLVDVFMFMLAHNDTDRERWSYYDEFLKSSKIRKARDEYPDFDDLIVKEIKSGGISRAMDLRDKLPTICAAPKIVKKYASSKTTFDDAYEDAKHMGGDSPELQRIKKFRTWLSNVDAVEEITEQNRAVRQKIVFELKQLEKRIGDVRSAVEKRNSSLN
jgi:hypothetical protein